jgi:hypothetical protein
MADRAKRITELTAISSIANNDVFIVVSNTAGTAVTRKITINNFRNGLPPIVVGTANTSCTGVVAVGNGLSINATGFLRVGNVVSVTDITSNTIEVMDTAEFSGNVYLGILDEPATSQLIHVHGTLHSNVIPHTPGNYQLGNTANYWVTVCTAGVTFNDSTTQNTAFQKVAAPANASSTGVAGQIAFDSNYIYYCVATNTWKRVAISTWP